MLVDLLYAWLAVRLVLSIAFGVRAANRLRYDETSEQAFSRMGCFHGGGAAVTWVLEALIRWFNLPPAGPVVQLVVFPLMLLYTFWVPLLDGLGFMAISGLVAFLLVRWRLVRYRDELLLGEPEQRIRAARACEFLGTWARTAVPELLEASTDTDTELRAHAARALGRIQIRPSEVLESLNRLLAD